MSKKPCINLNFKPKSKNYLIEKRFDEILEIIKIIRKENAQRFTKPELTSS
jgi:hypothetical protein